MIRAFRANERVTESYAEQNCIEIDGDYYQDYEAAEHSGYRYSRYRDTWLNENNAVHIDDMSDYLETDDENELYIIIGNKAYSIDYVSKNIDEFYYDVDTAEIVEVENGDAIKLETIRFLLDNEKPDHIPSKIWDKLPIRLDTKTIDIFDTYTLAA
jgi:hypothetical protein